MPAAGYAYAEVITDNIKAVITDINDDFYTQNLVAFKA